MTSQASYFSRCQQWLNGQSVITTELLQQTVEKFARQLESLADDELEKAEDLMRTMDLLDAELTKRDIPPSTTVVDNQPGEADKLLDFSPLVPESEAPVQTLTQEEKRQRLQQLLSQDGLALGVAGLKSR